MPNMKIYVDDSLFHACKPALVAALDPIRACIIRRLNVSQAACQISILPAIGLPDQALVNAEIQILPHADRTRAVLVAFGEEVRAILAAATGTRPAFRCMQHHPGSYVILN